MKLIEKINDRSAKIGVIGLGYVGLPLAIEFVQAGYTVKGIDINEVKITSLNSGQNYIDDVDDEIFKNSVINNSFEATTDFSVVKKLDAVSICVPTPLNKEKNPDISYIVAVMNEIKEYLHKDMIIILESTTYPGSTKELILPYITNCELVPGENVFLCFSPERIDPGNKIYNTKNTPKVIGGITNRCSEVGELLYSKIIEKIVKVSSTETAEMVKLLENTFRAVNIGLANEIAIMCEKLGVNAWEVIDAASTKPFGFMKFTPGPGLGGHCIPIDPFYLSWKLKTLDYDARFINLAGEINTNMPKHVFETIYDRLNESQKSINGSKVLILGVAYKKDVNDYRESPAIDIIQLLIESGAKTDYFDPYIAEIELNESIIFSLKRLNSEIIGTYDICVIVTDHSNVDYELLIDHSNQIIDTRNVYKDYSDSKIKRLGQGSKISKVL